MQSIRSHHMLLAVVLQLSMYRTAFEHLKRCIFLVHDLYKCLTIRASVYTCIRVAKCEQLALHSQAIHRLLILTYIFEFSQGFAGVPITAGCAGAVEQSLAGTYYE